MNFGYITIAEAAKLLGVSIDTLRRWDKSGKLVAIKKDGGTHRYYREKDLEIFASDLMKFASEWIEDGVEFPGTFYCATSSIFNARLIKMEYALMQKSGFEKLYSLIILITGEIGDNSFADIGEFEDGLAQVDYVTGAKQLINMSNQPVGDTYWEIGPFRDGVAKVKFGGGLFGYIDKTGKTIGRINGQYARAQDFYNGHAAVSDLHGFQFVNSAGEKVLPETTYSQVHVPVDGIRRVKKDGRFFFLDKNLHEIAGPFAFACDFGCGVAWVKEKNRYSLIDQRGVMVSGELTYSHVSGFHAGYGMAATEAGWIFVNKQGQRVGKECLPSSLNFDSSGFAVLRVPKQYIIIFHASGRRVGDGVYTGVLGFREGRCVVESFDAEAGRVFNWYAIDEDGKRISRENFAAMDSFHNGVSVVTLKNNERACIDRDGKRIFEQ